MPPDSGKRTVSKSLWRVLRLPLRVVIGIGLAALLLRVTLTSGDLEATDFWRELAGAYVPLLTLSFALYGGIIGITVIRWRLLLAMQGVHLGLWSVARLTMIGVFFNLAIPGAVSGDLLKMGYIARLAPDKKAASVLTIMVDRVFGLLGLFLVASVMVLISLPALLGLRDRPMQAAVFVVGLGSVAGAVGIGLVEMRQRLLRLPPVARLVAFGVRRLPAGVVATLQRLTSALEVCRGNRSGMVRVLLLSVLVHAGLGLNLYCLGAAYGERHVGVRDYFLAAQVGNVAGAIPVTPGGVGTRDATTARFLAAFEPRPEHAAMIVPLTVSVQIVFWGLVGAAVFVLTPGRRAEESAGKGDSQHVNGEQATEVRA